MKLDLTQTIKGLDNEDILFTEDTQVQQTVSSYLRILKKHFPDIFDQFIDKMKDDFPMQAPKTVKDMLTIVLMIGKKEATKEEKLADYKLLQRIHDSDVVTLTPTQAENLFNRVADTYNNNIVVGRMHELLVDYPEQTTEKAKEEVKDLLDKKAKK